MPGVVFKKTSAGVSAEFKNVSRYFGRRPALCEVSFELAAGGRYALVGPNGAGKSTLMRLLTGGLRPDAGEVLVAGAAPWGRDPATRRRLGFLAEGAPLAAELTLREHLALAGRLRGLDRLQTRREEERLCAGLNLAACLSRSAGLLSRGQARRAALAAALLGRPDFLILDEPTAGLDPEESARFRSLLDELPSSVTVLISSHILDEIFSLTEAALVVNAGRLAAFGPWSEVLPGAAADAGAENFLMRRYLALLRPETAQ
ncbi:MAG: ABC transporter ATP-binding protein [Candidatus Adiutrix sp.]|nr:ABC transporter ATP-binding protein [Candidatus Adiutrix sp.]